MDIDSMVILQPREQYDRIDPCYLNNWGLSFVLTIRGIIYAR